MSQPTIVYLHGVGHQTADGGWHEAITEGLRAAGYDDGDIAGVPMVAPRYGDLLAVGVDPDEAMPAQRRVRPPSPTQRAAYEQNQARLRRLLGDDPGDLLAGPLGGVPAVAADLGVKAATAVHRTLAEAGRYVASAKLRAAVLARVTESLPTQHGSRIVLVGHSLGSLVAIDLLDQLSESITVDRLVTLGSPAGIPAMHKGSGRLLKTFPYQTVGSWLNVVSVGDPVCAGRGLAGFFPAAHDAFVDLGVGAHGEDSYLRHPVVARTVGESVLGSLGQELVGVDAALDVAPSLGELVAIFSLYFAHETLEKLRADSEERAERYEAALRAWQADTAQRLVQLAVDDGRPVSADVAGLATGHAPRCPQVWELDDAVRLLVIAATTNLIAPVEIDARDASLAALRPAAAALGFGSSRGRMVAESVTSARKGLGLGETDWGRVAFGAVGVALLVGATGGLAAAAAPGLAGAAAITSALAGFGPGGMVGGMVMAGTMIGGGSAATSAAALGRADAETVETEVLRRMAHAQARQRLGLPRDPSDWLLLTQVESEVSRRLDAVEGLSDGRGPFSETPPSIKQDQRKRDQVRKGITWMLRQGLGPAALGRG